GEHLLERVRVARPERAQVLDDPRVVALEATDVELAEGDLRSAVEHDLEFGGAAHRIDACFAAGETRPQIAALVERIDEPALAPLPFTRSEEAALGQQPARAHEARHAAVFGRR